MSYEKKALGTLDNIVDAIYYEEGRLAIINKYGTLLNDEEKVQATQLITKQRVNLDRLFEIYKNELFPLMGVICKTGEEMAPLVEKLVSAEMIAKQRVFQQDVAGSDNNVAPIITSATVPADNSVVSEEGANEAAARESSIEPEGEVSKNVSFDSNVALNSGADAVSTPVFAEDGVVTGSEVVPLNGDTNPVENANSPGGISNEGSVSETKVSGTAEETVGQNTGEGTPMIETSNFVLSPIDEGVAPVPTVQEKESVEDKNMGRYTKTTEGAVRAILVTKKQYKNLLNSKETQKGLLNGEQAGVASEGTIDSVATQIPETSGDVVLPTIGDLSTSVGSVAGEVKENSSTDGGFLPMINEETSSGSVVNPEKTAVEATQGGVLPIIEGSGADASIPVTQAPVNQNSQSELQAMIEQANALYKEGKVAEAQALFDKVGAINREIQAANGTQFVKK